MSGQEVRLEPFGGRVVSADLGPLANVRNPNTASGLVPHEDGNGAACAF
jgi:hypothetical protein